MPQHQLYLKPKYTHLLGPKIAATLIKYTLASIVVYHLIQFINQIWTTNIHNTYLLTALLLLTVGLTIIEIKPKLIHAHYTHYDFYDTHIVIKQGIFVKNKVSVPYAQITNIQSTTNLWDQITNASDIVLKLNRNDRHEDVILKSIENADQVEHDIYKLLKTNKQHQTDSAS